MKHRSHIEKRMFREPTLPNDLTDLLREKLLALPASVKADYLKEQVFSKFVSRDTAAPEVRAQAAMSKWLAQERTNEATEDRLNSTPWDYNILPRVTYQQFVEFCRDIIVDLLGDTPPVDCLVGSFSGGASTSRPRTQSHPARKYVGKAHVTSDFKDTYLELVQDELPIWFDVRADPVLSIELVPGNVMFTVPKETDIDRVAAKEPDLNMFVQKGIGDFIRKRLLRAKINLNDQSINRSLALLGSQTGQLATLDLSSASDSITRELVFDFLPVTWFTLLDSSRSRVTTLLGGEEHRNVMFSSMGNGFTFELESLLFYTLMRATAYFTGTPGVISVYGDDLIIPSEMADSAMWVLNYFGFKVNSKKSFWSGPFRESCGGHYWNGVDITPFYIKAPIASVVDVIHVANKLREWGQYRVNGGLSSPFLNYDIEPIWQWLKSFVPPCLWGGEDLSFKYQLVSLDTPSSRLHEPTKPVVVDDLRGYLHWLNAAWRRTVLKDPIVTSRYSRKRDSLELRPVRVRTVPQLEALFVHEYESYMP